MKRRIHHENQPVFKKRKTPEDYAKEFKDYMPSASEEDVETVRMIMEGIEEFRRIIESQQPTLIEKPSNPHRQMRTTGESAVDFIESLKPITETECTVQQSIAKMKLYNDIRDTLGTLFSQLDVYVLENIFSFCRGRELIQMGMCCRGLRKLVDQKHVWEFLCRTEWRVDYRLDTFILGPGRMYVPQNKGSKYWDINDSIKLIRDEISFEYSLEDLKRTYFRHEESNIFIILTEKDSSFTHYSHFYKDFQNMTTKELMKECDHVGLAKFRSRRELIHQLMEYNQNVIESRKQFKKLYLLHRERDFQNYKKQQMIVNEKIPKLNSMAEAYLEYARENKHVYIADHLELSIFLRHAKDGDLFIFRPGRHSIPLYSFVIDASISLIGDTITNEAVIIEDVPDIDHDYCIEVKLKDSSIAARFCNLTIHQCDGYEGIICTRVGHTMIENCLLFCSASGIRVCDKGSVFSFNTLIVGGDENDYGASFEKFSKGAFLNCGFFYCSHNPLTERDQPAISLSPNGTDLYFRNCQISKNGGHGIAYERDNKIDDDDHIIHKFFEKMRNRKEEIVKQPKIIFDSTIISENEFCVNNGCKNLYPCNSFLAH